jgi:hypothetical protein
LNGNEDVFINVKRFVAASIAKNTALGISNKNIWEKRETPEDGAEQGFGRGDRIVLVRADGR